MRWSRYAGMRSGAEWAREGPGWTFGYAGTLGYAGHELLEVRADSPDARGFTAEYRSEWTDDCIRLDGYASNP